LDGTKEAEQAQGIIIFFFEKGKEIIKWEQDFCTPQNIISS
jgi:hypothetical protein